jgi:hypothetical protein
MKILSITRDEGRVVELTREEFKQFAILAKALEGLDENRTHWGFEAHGGVMFSIEEDIDFSGVFGAIKAFYEAKFRSNELRQLLNRFDDFLKVQR